MTMAHLGATKKKLHNFVNEAGISEGNKSLTTSRMVDLRCKVGRVSLRRAMKSMGVKASNLKRESKQTNLKAPTTYCHVFNVVSQCQRPNFMFSRTTGHDNNQIVLPNELLYHKK